MHIKYLVYRQTTAGAAGGGVGGGEKRGGKAEDVAVIFTPVSCPAAFC